MSMPTAPTPTKTCIKCGTDCSNKPRTKDAQGRYTCKACYDEMVKKAAATRAAPAPVGAVAAKPAAKPGPKPATESVFDGGDDGAVMASLLESSPGVITETCPSCGNGLTSGAVVCTICGYNKETGRAMGVKVLKAAKERRSGPRISLSMSPMMTFLICLAVFAGPVVLLLTAPDLVLVAQGVSLIFSLGLVVWALVQGFRTAVGTGIILLVTMFIPLINLYWLYFIFSVNENDHLKAAWGASILANIVMFAVAMSHMS